MKEILRKTYGPIAYVLYQIEEELNPAESYEWVCQVQGAAAYGTVAAWTDESAIRAVEWAWPQHALGILRTHVPLRAVLPLKERDELIREIECELAWMQHEALHGAREVPGDMPHTERDVRR